MEFKTCEEYVLAELSKAQQEIERLKQMIRENDAIGKMPVVSNEKEKIIAELKKFAEEHNEGEINWKNRDQLKYYLFFNYESEVINIGWAYCVKSSNIYYFTSEEIALKAIDEIGEDRLKKYYFEVE